MSDRGLIGRLDFGYWDGAVDVIDKEPQLFVHTSQFNGLNSPDSRIIIGRKGAGKTALEKTLTKERLGEYRTILRIDANEFDLPALVTTHRNLHSSVGGTLELRRTWTNNWIHSILTGCMRLLLDDPSLPRHHGKLMESYLTRIQAGKKPSFFASLLERLEALVRREADLKTQAAFEVVDQLRNYPIDSTDFRDAQKALAEVLSHGKPVLVTFDHIDRYFDVYREHHRFDKDARHAEADAIRIALTGLVQAVYTISTMPSLRDSIQFKVFLPQDKFEGVQIRDMDKIMQYVFKLKWEPEELREFIARRIAYSLDIRDSQGNLKTDVASTWYRVFPRSITNDKLGGVPEEICEYLVRHSRLAPRDLQMYCHQIKHLATQQEAAEVTPAIVRAAVREKSKGIVQIIFLEYEYEYPFLRPLIECFRGAPHILTSDDFFRRVTKFAEQQNLGEQPMEVASILFRIGFIGGVSTGKLEEGYRYPSRMVKGQKYHFIFSHVNRHYEISNAKSVCIHPVFYDYLNCCAEEEMIVG